MRSAMLIVILLVLGAAAPAGAQQAPQVVFVEYKNPVAAGLFSFFIPGAGQAYNSEWNKAITYFGISAGSFWIAMDASDRCVGTSADETCESALLPGLAYVATWGLSVINAARAANRLNAEERARIQSTVSTDGRVGLLVSIAWR